MNHLKSIIIKVGFVCASIVVEFISISTIYEIIKVGFISTSIVVEFISIFTINKIIKVGFVSASIIAEFISVSTKYKIVGKIVIIISPLGFCYSNIPLN